MTTIRHSMMHYKILNILNGFSLRIPVLYLSSSLMMKMNNRHTYDTLIDFMVPLIVLVDNLF